jgi:peroxiredoxin
LFIDILCFPLQIAVGDTAPDFSLQDQNGRTVSLSKFRGKPVVLYFYPKDDTPGCTKQVRSGARIKVKAGLLSLGRWVKRWGGMDAFYRSFLLHA